MKLLFENKRYIVPIFLTIFIVFCTPLSSYADENSAPVFTEGARATRTVAENTASGTNIGAAFTATDPDSGDTLTYSLRRGDRSSFRIDPSTGQVRTQAALDFETKNAYTDLAVRATDSKGNKDVILVTINVTNVNEAPNFTEGSSATRSVAENTTAGQNIGTPVAATDVDANTTLTYTLSGTDAAAFSIVSTTGQLQTKAALDYETKNSYSVRITASDGTLTDTIDVTINVTDVAENNAPVFTDGASTTRFIAENTAARQNIGTPIAATDADTGDTLTYTLGGTDATAFSIVRTSGQLRTKSPLDYEKKNAYAVTVSVSDGNGGSDSISVRINVRDVPENRAPVFTEGAAATRSIAENTPAGTNIGTPIAATDADNDRLLYGIYSLGGQDGKAFSIVGTSGQLRTKAALDYETKNSYTFSIFVEDSKGGRAAIPVTIHVTDANEAPTFTDGTSTTRSVAENTPAGTNIGTPFQATDPDSGDTLTYSLQRGDKGSFRIDPNTGQVKTLAALDYETKHAYTDLAVRATDSTGLVGSTRLTINVTDVTETELPITPPLSDRTPAVRDAIVRAVPGVNNANDVTAAHLAAIRKLGLSSRSISSLKAGDFNGLTALFSLRLHHNSITDISPLEDLTSGSLVFLVLENNKITDISPLEGLTSLVSLYAKNNSISDISALEGLTSLKTLNLGNYPINGVSVGNNSISDISVLEGLTSLKWLDLYGNSISDISALEGLTSLVSLALDGNSISDISVLEDLTSLTQLLLGNNSISNISVLEDLTSLNHIRLDNNKITDISVLEDLTSLITLALDGNSISDISVLEGLTSLTQLLLGNNSISDISALEDLTSLITLRLDNNSISDISALEGMTSLETLHLNGNSISDISVLAGLTSLKTLRLQGNPISDYGPLRRLKAANPDVKIDVNINNNIPVFTDGDSTTRSIAENTASGTNIGAAVSATDADTNDTLTYSLGGTDAESFSIVSTSGQLQTKAALDYETQSSYTVTVDVSDGNDGLDRITVTINVTDEAGAAPSIETPPVLPDTTALLSNYPNPFNPETWIPYQLAKPAEVTLTIYDVRGVVVRELKLGHQPAGVYHSRSRAIYWDGRNGIGERVASGLYFYTFTAGDFTATHKLLIRK